MPNNQRLLEGEVMDVEADPSEAARLRDELQRVGRERDTLRAENVRLRQRVNQVEGPAAQLRQTLDPLYNALRAIMGEIEVIDPRVEAPGQSAAAAAPDDRTSEAWEEWKTRMGGAAAKIITALQKHGSADHAQLAILIGTSRKQTVYDAISKLNRAGLITKNGDRFALKQL